MSREELYAAIMSGDASFKPIARFVAAIPGGEALLEHDRDIDDVVPLDVAKAFAQVILSLNGPDSVAALADDLARLVEQGECES